MKNTGNFGSWSWLSSWKGDPYEFRSELSWSWDSGVFVERDDASSSKANARILIVIAESLFPLKRWMSQHPKARDEVSGIEFTIWNLTGRCCIVLKCLEQT